MSQRWNNLFSRPALYAFLAIAFYTLQFIVRSTPNFMRGSFETQFHIDTLQFGFFASIYYYSYTLLQIPCGLLLDRYGPILMLRWSLLAFAMSALCSAMSPHFYAVLLSRFLLGGAAASSFIGGARLMQISLSPKTFPFLVGCNIAVGKLGAAAFNFFAPYFDCPQGWTVFSWIICVLTAGLAMAGWFGLRESSGDSLSQSKVSQGLIQVFQGLKQVVLLPTVWWIALYSFLLYLPLSVLADAWMSSFLSQARGISLGHGAQLSGWLLIGACVGSPLASLLANRFGNVKVMHVSAICSMLSALWLIVWPPAWFSITQMLVFCVGFFPLGQALVFILLARLIPQPLVSTASGFVNTLTMLGGLLLPPVIAGILSWHQAWTGSDETSLANYQMALSLVPVGLLMACVIMITGRIQECFLDSEKNRSGPNG